MLRPTLPLHKTRSADPVHRCKKTQARRESPAGLSPMNEIAPVSWSAAVPLPLWNGSGTAEGSSRSFSRVGVVETKSARRTGALQKLRPVEMSLCRFGMEAPTNVESQPQLDALSASKEKRQTDRRSPKPGGGSGLHGQTRSRPDCRVACSQDFAYYGFDLHD